MGYFTSSALVKCLFAFVSVAHVLYVPFTKVEESFNLQAIHDILYLKNNFSQYDHYQFPGVVPRTFLGPLIISSVAMPLFYFLEENPLLVQILSSLFFSSAIFISNLNVFTSFRQGRIILAAFVMSGLFNFTGAIKKIYDSSVEKWTLVFMLSQFHFMFYISRTLPNTFGLILCKYLNFF